MKEYKIIVDFRRAYLKLNYANEDITLTEVYAWVEEWCKKQGIIEPSFINTFRLLVHAYANKDLIEKILLRYHKKKELITSPPTV